MSVFGDLFDEFVEGTLQVTFNAGADVQSLISTSPVNAEDSEPDTLKEVVNESVVTEAGFTDLLLERLLNNNLAGFKQRLEITSIYGDPIALYQGITTNLSDDLSEFVSTTLPGTGLAGWGDASLYESEYSLRFSVGAYEKLFRGPLRFEMWMFEYLGWVLNYDLYNNIAQDQSAAIGRKVQIKDAKLRLPGQRSDYPETFLEPVFPLKFRKTFPNGTWTNVYETDWLTYEFVETPAPTTENPNPQPVDPRLTVYYTYEDDSGNTIISGTDYYPPQRVIDDCTLDHWQLPVTGRYVFNGDVYTASRFDDTVNLTTQAYKVFTWTFLDGSGLYPAFDNYQGNAFDNDGKPILSSAFDVNYIRPVNPPTQYMGLDVPDEWRVESDNWEYWEDWAIRAEAYGMPPAETAAAGKAAVDMTDEWNSYFEYAVSANAQEPVLVEYLWRHFERWASIMQNSPLSNMNDSSRITRFETEVTYNRDYRFSQLSKEIKSGLWTAGAKAGQYFRTDLTEYVNETFTDAYRNESWTGTWVGLKFVWQKSETEHHIIRVGYPVCTYGLRRSAIASVGADDPRFLLPVNLAVLQEMGGFKHEQVLYKSLRYTHVIAVVEDISWTDTEIFRTFLKIIKVGSTITFAITGIYGLAQQFALNYLTAALLYGALSVAVRETIKIAIRELGIEVGYALAVAALATGVYQGLNGGALLNGLVSPTLLIQTSNGLVSAINTQRMEKVQKGYQQLEYEREKWGEFYDEEQKKLEESQELLTPTEDALLANYVIKKVPMQFYGETPQSFYNRTIHAGNIGTNSFEFVHNYVEQKLKLPSFHESVGNRLYIP